VNIVKNPFDALRPDYISPLRPSGSYQWVKCSGSVELQKQYPPDPNDPNIAAEEGTACHWLAEQLLLCINQGLDFPDKSEAIGAVCPDNNVMIDEDMWDAAQMYIDAIINKAGDTVQLEHLAVEQSVMLDHIYPKMWGTPDCWFYDGYTNTLHVFDLKYGMGTVEAYYNSQLMIYTSGIIATLLHPNVANDENLKVELTIIQPRKFHEMGPVRTFYIKAVELRGKINIIEGAAHYAMGDSTQCVPGQHCKHCSAKYPCNALQQTIYNAVDVVTSASPVEMDDNSIAAEWTLLNYISDIVKYRKIAIEAKATAVINNGGILPGWIMESVIARLKWTNTDKAKALGALLECDFEKHDLITPTQAITMLEKKKINESIIDNYAARGKSGLKLKADDGTRLAMIFNNFNNNG